MRADLCGARANVYTLNILPECSRVDTLQYTSVHAQHVNYSARIRTAPHYPLLTLSSSSSIETLRAIDVLPKIRRIGRIVYTP